MVLSERERIALRAVCDTLIPGGGDSLPTMVEQTLQTAEDPSALAQLAQALRLLESPVAGGLLHGQWAAFSRLDRPARELVLRRWAVHPLPPLRQAFQAFKRLTGFLFGAAEGSALWGALGYTGSDARPAAAPLLQMTALGDEAVLEADAVVIGSGAGGGVVAADLASRGLHVVVLEKGGYFPEAEMGAGEARGMEHMYLDRGLTATRDLSVIVLAGSAVGGGTLVNWTASIAPPDWLRAEWEQEQGLTGLTSPAFQQCVDEVLGRLNVNTGCSETLPESSAGRLLAGCQALGYHGALLPRNVNGCGDDCGSCTFGCRDGAKQSTARTYLVDAARAGARIIARADVRRVLMENNRVIGVDAVVDGRPLQVRAPRVVLAAGAIGSPAILLRSGLSNPNIGQHLHLHPVMAVLGRYGTPVNPWSGRLLSAYSAEFARLDGNWGFLLEIAPAHPGLGCLGTPWESGEQYRRELERLHHMAVTIVLARDKGSGRVTVDRHGLHRIDYRVSPYDMGHLLRGQEEAIRVHAAAGAEAVATMHATPNLLENPTAKSLERYVAATARLPHGPNQVAVYSAHQMGTCRMGSSPRSAVADPQGQVYGVKGLYVADASAFPAASGVNPMITIMSLARWVARGIA